MYYRNPAAQATIRERAKKGLVIFSDHGTAQSASRRIEQDKVLDCLKTGILAGEDWDAEHQSITYRITKTLNLKWTLFVVVALDETHNIVITAFRREKR